MAIDHISNHDPEDIKTQLLGLQEEIDYLTVANQAFWSLLVNVSKKMQVSSAVIKATVSSLLNNDILWDGSTQNELLEIIDSSSNQLARQVMLLTILSKIESDSFSLKSEPNDIQEILSISLGIVGRSYPEIFSVQPAEINKGTPVFVDYEYLSLALVLLLEFIGETEKKPQDLTITTEELKDHWVIGISELSKDNINTILNVFDLETDLIFQNQNLLPTKMLMLYVIKNIFEMQSIRIENCFEIGKPMCISLKIPAVKY